MMTMSYIVSQEKVKRKSEKKGIGGPQDRKLRVLFQDFLTATLSSHKNNSCTSRKKSEGTSPRGPPNCRACGLHMLRC